MVGTRAPELEPEKERILPPQARAIPVKISEVRDKVQGTVRQEQQRNERVAIQVVGAVAQVFTNAINENPNPVFKSAFNDSQLKNLLEMKT